VSGSGEYHLLGIFPRAEFARAGPRVRPRKPRVALERDGEQWRRKRSRTPSNNGRGGAVHVHPEMMCPLNSPPPQRLSPRVHWVRLFA
jgi:hypothetical protein